MFRYTLVLAAALAPSALAQDEVLLKNGDRLSGSVLELDGDQLRLKTSYAGILKIDWKQVRALETTSKRKVEFATGLEMEGIIRRTDNDLLMLEGSGLESPASLDEIVAIQMPADTDGSDRGGRWTGSADFGITIARGNSDIDHYALSFNPRRITDKDRLTIDLRGLYSIQGGGSVNSIQSGTARYDRFLSPRTFVFALGEAETHEAQMLDLRTREGGGFGFKMTPRRETVLSFYGGINYLQENFETTELAHEVEALAAFELTSKINERFDLGTKGQLMPFLTGDRYLLNWDAHMKWLLWSNFTVGLSFYDKFDSLPPIAGVEKNDFGMLTTFGWKF